MNVAEIVKATESDADWVAELIGDSFQYLDATAWLVPDPAERVKVLSRNFLIFVEHGLTHGEVHVTTDRSGAAVWIRAETAPPPPPYDYERRLAEACGTWTDRFRQLDKLFEAHHPAGAHHHLAFLAVRKDRQGQGIGSTLLDHHHLRLDREQMAAFLEASSSTSRDLYLRHGYRLLGEPYATPNRALFWPMWRDPRR